MPGRKAKPSRIEEPVAPAKASKNIRYPVVVEKTDVRSAPDPKISKPLKSVDAPPAPQPKKEISAVDVGKLQKQLEMIQKQLEMVSQTQKKEEESEDVPKKVEELKPVDFTVRSSFVLMPQLGGVDYPLYAGTAKAFSVPVGSKVWLDVLDQLRTVGWPYYGDFGIENYLYESSYIVWRDLNYNVVYARPKGATTNFEPYTNMETHSTYEDFRKVFIDAVFLLTVFEVLLSRKMEFKTEIDKFCMWFPDASRQQEKMEKGYAELLSEIHRKLGPEALAPRQVLRLDLNDLPV